MRNILLLLILSISLTGYSDGTCGAFYIIGKAYSANNTLLKNALISVTHNGETIDYITSESGEFKIKINWMIPCRSGVSHEEYNKIYQENNQPWIDVTFKCQGVKVENEWKKYSGLFEESIKSGQQYLDLYFKN